MSRIAHFYIIDFLLEKVDSMKKWLPFCSHFDVFLCITDQLWAWQDGWTSKRVSRRIFWGMGYISKIFFKKPQAADLCSHGQNLLIFLANFSIANFHLIFLLNKSFMKTWKRLSIIAFGWHRILWVYLGSNYGPWETSIKQHIALSGVPQSGYFQTHLIDWLIDYSKF